MKIIHVITAFGIGGAEKLLLDVVNRQVSNHEVYIVYLKKVEVLISYLDERVKKKHISLSVNTINELKNYYKSISPDIIHTHVGHADFLGIWSARKTNANIFCTMHNIYFKKNIIDNFYFEIYRLLFNHFANKTKVISISKSVEKHVLIKLKVPSNRSFLIYNAIAPDSLFDKQKDLQKKNTNENVTTLLFVGRLVKQKSVHTLLKAIKVIKEKGYENHVKLLIVGDGELRLSLETLASELGIEKIVDFEGERRNVESYYYSADIFVLPSMWEGFGMVILEAFRAKLAVIASNIEGPSELITDNFNGLLFNTKNYNELAQKIILLIENKLLRQTLAENGHLSFNEKYHIDDYVKELNKVYEI